MGRASILHRPPHAGRKRRDASSCRSIPPVSQWTQRYPCLLVSFDSPLASIVRKHIGAWPSIGGFTLFHEFYAFFCLVARNLFGVACSHDVFALRTQDTVSIYWANIAVLTACYAYGFTIGKPDGDNAADQNQPQWLKFIYKVSWPSMVPSRFTQ